MKKTILTCIIVLTSVLMNAQVYLNWAKSSVAANNYSVNTADWLMFGSYFNSIVVDGSGNVYTSGTFTGTVDFDPGPSVYTLSTASSTSLDGFVTKLDASGNFVWARQFKTTPGSKCRLSSMKMDNSGNLIFTGSLQGVVDFDPGPGSYTLTAGTGCFINKIDAFGNFLWAKNVSGGAWGTLTWGTSITNDIFGNIIVAGEFSGVVDFDPGPGTYTLSAPTWSNISNSNGFALKLDASGNFIWAKKWGGVTQVNGAKANAVTTDNSGNVYTIGTFINSLGFDIDPGPGVTTLTANTNYSGFLCKLDPLGNFLSGSCIMNKSVISQSVTLPQSICIDGSGNIYTCGSFFGTVDFDPGPSTNFLSSAGGTGFISKLDKFGNFLWCKNSGFEAYKIISDTKKNVFVTGAQSSGSASSIGLAKFDSLGNVLHSTIFGTFANGLDRGNSIALDASENIHLTGYYSTTVDFDPTASVVNLTSSNTGIFTTKFCQAPSYPFAIYGNTIICSGSPLSNYSVNLSIGATSYSWSLPAGWLGSSASNTFIPTSISASGVLSVTANNSCGASLAQTLQVTNSSLPTLTVSSNTNFLCPGNTATLTANGASTYTWVGLGSGSSVTVSPITSTTYSVSGTNSLGCVGSNTFSQHVLAPVTIVSSSSVLCLGNTATLTANCLDSMFYMSLSWNPSPNSVWLNTAVISPTATTVYTLTGIYFYGTCSFSPTVQLVVSPCTAVENLLGADNEIKLFPNPVADVLSISGIKNADVIIYDQLGRQLKNQAFKNEEIKLKISDLERGIYYIDVSVDKKRIVRKIVKE